MEKFYLMDFNIICGVADSHDAALQDITTTIHQLNDNNETDYSLPLRSMSPITWESHIMVELLTTTIDVIIFVRSKKGDRLGYCFLKGDDLRKSNSCKRVDKQLLMEEGTPVLSLSLEMIAIPWDPVTVPPTQNEEQKPPSKEFDHNFQALRAIPDSHPRKPHLLRSAGRHFREQFCKSGNDSDISNSILALEIAIKLILFDHKQYIEFLEDAAYSFEERYSKHGDSADIDRAISLFETVINITPEGHPNLPRRLSNFGNAYSVRFEHTQDVTDISKAISARRTAVKISPPGSAELPYLLVTLMASCFFRYLTTEDPSDLSESIAAQKRSVDLTPKGDPEMLERVMHLGHLYNLCFERTQDVSDVSEAISTHKKAIDLLPNGDPSLSGQQDMLGSAYSSRFKITGNPTDLSEAINAYQLSIDLTPSSHRALPDRLNNLGKSYLLRLDCTRDRNDALNAIAASQRAFDLTPPDKPNFYIRLSNLGNTYLHCFKTTGELAHINAAISNNQKAVDAIPPGSIDQIADAINNLGSSYLLKCLQTGDLTDISKAVEAYQKAVNITPDDHEALPTYLTNLANAHSRRSEWTGDPRDAFEAKASHQRAIELSSTRNPQQAARLNNYGDSLLQVFDHTKDPNDLAAAISAFLTAINATSEGSPNLVSYNNNVGISYLRRFQSMGDLEDISRATPYLQKAVTLTPRDHADFPVYAHNLALLYSRKFHHSRDRADIEKAISLHDDAISLTPEGHAEISNWLKNLGTSYLLLFELCTQDLADLRTAARYYEQAATSSLGQPWMRLRTANLWAQCSETLGDRAERLSAYEMAIRLMSEVAGLEQTIQRRHANLLEFSDLSISAAAAAFSLEELEKALEWLDHGRCLVWEQLNNLRTPIDKLREHDAILADEFLEVSRSLERSGSRSDTVAIEASMSQKMSIQAESSAHILLARRRVQLIQQIRSIPRFRDFLQPLPTSRLLQNLPNEGPVIVVNVHKDRCDALALLVGADSPVHIPLPQFSHAEAARLRDGLRTYLEGRHLRSRGDGDHLSTPNSAEGKLGDGPGADSDDLARASTRRVPVSNDEAGIHGILQDMWLHVVKPILDGLAIMPNPSNPTRIWWCTTGPLAFLPIHAAGIYRGKDASPATCLSNYAISSYTPTLQALLAKTKKPNPALSKLQVLLISQPETPGLTRIPGTSKEVKAVQAKLANYPQIEMSRLNGAAATTSSVSEKMTSHSWIHLACHAVQDTTDPLQSGFHLQDKRLALADIMKIQIPEAGLAFLSACQTSTGDEKLSEEAVHLAAGMLAAGYQSVVGTMWSIKDTYAPQVAETFYSHLLAGMGERPSGDMDSAGAAQALHHSIQCLRAKVGDTEDGLLVWVPYVHFGL